jgi:flagellar hook-associated protein FlgK
MASTFRGLETGKSALKTASINQDVTSHNISNAKTTGYTRQYAVTSARTPVGSNYLVSQIFVKRVGQGVQVDDVRQYRSDYLDQQYRTHNSTYNYYNSRAQGLTYMTDIMSELDDDGTLTESVDNFTSALQTLTKDPTSAENRLNVQQQATSLIQNTQYTYNEMKSLRENQDDSVNTVTASINSISTQIASLNHAIAKYEQGNTTANDLRDERNNLLDELSGLVDITYDLNPDNSSMVDVKIGDGTLVSGTLANSIEVSKTYDATTTEGAASIASNYGLNPNKLTLQEKVVDESGTITGTTAKTIGTSATDTIQLSSNSKSELYAHMELRDSTSSDSPGIPYYMEKLNSFAKSVVSTVNDIHKTGYTYPNSENSNTSSTGINFFAEMGDGKTIDDFALSSEVSASIWNIAASSSAIDLTAASTNATNGTVAQKLYDAMDAGTSKSLLTETVGHLAVTTKTNTGLLDTSQSLLKSITSQRSSLSGVSLNEETTNLIQFQQSFSVAARMVTTIDDMLSTLINSTGRVGL